MEQASHTIDIGTGGQGLYEVTAEITSWVAAQGLETGLLTVFCPHTSASLLLQENADPMVQRDLKEFFAALAPEAPGRYAHSSEGPDDMPAHIRAALTQSQISIPVMGGRPALGTWQGIYFFEHRARPHQRQLLLHLSGG